MRRFGFRMSRVAHRMFGGTSFSATDENRSGSDDGLYVAAVEEALSSRRHFARFKRDARYNAILEHLSEAQGEAYLRLVRAHAPWLLDERHLAAFRRNDALGAPRTYDYGRPVGRMSPTTLRYVKVAADLLTLFDFSGINSIAELGCGYGGQTLILDAAVERPLEFHLFDLPPVLALSSRYLESHVLRGSYQCHTLNQVRGTESYDLVLSNYAFSELPRHLQLRYFTKVVSRARRGYMTMNSGAEPEPRSDCLRIEELTAMLPDAKVLAEEPLTAPHNRIVVWGADRETRDGLRGEA
jgi:putative sugar O-methyltransferase